MYLHTYMYCSLLQVMLQLFGYCHIPFVNTVCATHASCTYCIQHTGRSYNQTCVAPVMYFTVSSPITPTSLGVPPVLVGLLCFFSINSCTKVVVNLISSFTWIQGNKIAIFQNIVFTMLPNNDNFTASVESVQIIFPKPTMKQRILSWCFSWSF